jgi:5-methyltetrahydrofolate--homocysteine methyltransferase
VFRINGDRAIIFDGAMGTMLQNRGLKLGDLPEALNLTAPEVVRSIHEEYLDAGADVILANTFGVNRYKAAKAGHSVKELVSAAVRIAREAVGDRKEKYVALDIGPCGRIMAPTGDLPFEEAVEVFAEVVRAGVEAGADFILTETFTDLYELKAAVLAAKENSNLPLVSTMSFEESGVTFFGATVESMVMTLEGLGVDALGVNCSLGPKQLVPIVDRILAATSIPVLVQPNAGLPSIVDGRTKYDVTPEEFAGYVKGFVEKGVSLIGSCCGTTPAYTKLIKETVGSLPRRPLENHRRTCVCSPSKPLYFSDGVAVIGERLNPTGKKALQAALRANDMDYVLREAIREQEQGAALLDVNMGLPDVDEPALLERAVKEVQAVVDLPLQLDSSNPQALERAARIYNGKPLINSVSGKKESLAKILPIAKKYGAAVLGLALDDDGIPDTAEKRFAIAEKIIAEAQKHGIPREDVLIDCLVMTVSAQQNQATETLKAVRMVKERLGACTVLGVSNVSFGLPARPVINRTMLAMALANGLDAPIMNPGDAGMAETVAAFRVLASQDKNSADFIAKFADYAAPAAQSKSAAKTSPTPELQGLAHAIAKGLKNDAREATKAELAEKKPLDVIEKVLVPTLDAVGRDYESGVIFLPQLIQSAEAAKAAFEQLRAALARDGTASAGARTKIVVATVRGDIHDIGKNIVKVLFYF